MEGRGGCAGRAISALPANWPGFSRLAAVAFMEEMIDEYQQRLNLHGVHYSGKSRYGCEPDVPRAGCVGDFRGQTRRRDGPGGRRAEDSRRFFAWAVVVVFVHVLTGSSRLEEEAYQVFEEMKGYCGAQHEAHLRVQ